MRRERVIEVPAEQAWAVVGRPELLHLWFPGIVDCAVEGDTRTITTGSGVAWRRTLLTNDPLQRRFQYRISGGFFREHLATIDVIALGAGPLPRHLRSDADPATMAIVLGGAIGGALEELARQLEAGAGPALDALATPHRPRRPPDGPQDPLRHHRPAALRHARLQRRRASAARPVVDAAGRRRASATSGPCPQSVVCMPSRSTMLTGQHPSTHGVWMNGVALPVDAPSVAAVLHRAGYRTALVGKPHFEPFLDPFGRFTENGLARTGVPTAQTRRGTTAPSARTAASTTSSSPPTRPVGRPALRPLDDGRAPRGPRRLLRRARRATSR